MRDLVLLVATGLLVSGACLLLAGWAARPRTAHEPAGRCVERWDEQQEWQPHLDCVAPAWGFGRHQAR